MKSLMINECFDGHDIRVLGTHDEPLFVAKDVCEALGLTNHRMAVSNLDEDEKRLIAFPYTNGGVSSTYSPSLGGNDSQTIVITESGLYTLILRCRDAVVQGTVAHRFRKWVTSELLPAVRKKEVVVGRLQEGDQFGKLTVVGPALTKVNTRHTYMRCQCECGKHIEVRATHLRTGVRTDCGKCDRLEDTEWEFAMQIFQEAAKRHQQGVRDMEDIMLLATERLLAL